MHYAKVSSKSKEKAETSNKSEFLLMFHMMQEQQREQQRQYQEATQRQFKLELEEIRQRAKEKRFDMARFMADLQLQGGKIVVFRSCSI